jgi:hypothetical protein
MARAPRSLFAAPLVVTAFVAAPAGADVDPSDKGKIRFDGYQCYEGPEGKESSVPCPKKLLPKAKKKQPVYREAGDGACRTTGRKQVRCPPNIILPEPQGTTYDDGGGGVRFDEGMMACVEWVNMQCPEGMSCNPPPPQPVACPDELLPSLAPKVKPSKKKKGKCYLGTLRVRCP